MRVLLESEIRRMTAARKRFSQEFKDELCQEVIATSKPIREVAEAYGVGTETLRKWLNKYRHTHGGTETELTVSERARLKELEREVCDLRAEALFLKKATADSTGRRNTLRYWRCSTMATADWSKKTSDVPEGVRRQWSVDPALRPPMRSPGSPDLSRAVQRQFWRLIATGIEIEPSLKVTKDYVIFRGCHGPFE